MPAKNTRLLTSVRVPPTALKHIEALVAAGRYKSVSEAHRTLLERGLESVVPAPVTRGPGAPTRAAKPRPQRLERLHFRVDPELAKRLRGFAAQRGYATGSEALGDLVAEALDQEEGRRAVPAQKADEVLDSLRVLGSLLDTMGPGVLGTLHLLAHWATKSGSLKVNEDDLLAEIHAVGQSQWRQLLEEVDDPEDPSKVH